MKVYMNMANQIEVDPVIRVHRRDDGEEGVWIWFGMGYGAHIVVNSFDDALALGQAITAAAEKAIAAREKVVAFEQAQEAV